MERSNPPTLRRSALGLATVLIVAISACGFSSSGEVTAWEPAPGEVVGPDSRAIEIVVLEKACASGDSAEGRIQKPEIEYEEDAVIVTVRVRPKGGFQECPANPPTCYLLELDEPLGSRVLLMGTTDGRHQPQAGHLGPMYCGSLDD